MQVMAFNSGDVEVETLGGTKLEVVQDFKYLGSWIASSAKDIKVCRALAWSALHKMKRIWVPDMNRRLNGRLFVRTHIWMPGMGTVRARRKSP